MYMKSEDTPTYVTNKLHRPLSDEEVIAKTLQIIERRLAKPGEAMSSPQIVKDYLKILLADREHEMFSVIFLDAQHRVLEYIEMFRGTLKETSVYPREVVKEALRLNAGAVIFAHNHPSGMAEPSRADEMLTNTLKNALALVDVKVLDHIVVGGMTTISFAERGLL